MYSRKSGVAQNCCMQQCDVCGQSTAPNCGVTSATRDPTARTSHVAHRKSSRPVTAAEDFLVS
jgi:hypothetical protein